MQRIRASLNSDGNQSRPSLPMKNSPAAHDKAILMQAFGISGRTPAHVECKRGRAIRYGIVACIAQDL
jgi:hypothetical protein